jgi:hypothetical protein
MKYKGHITGIDEFYPCAPHWIAKLLVTGIKESDIHLGWLNIWYLNDPIKQLYHCLVEKIYKYEEALRQHIVLEIYWSPEVDVDEGKCISDLSIGDVEFEYDNGDEGIWVDSMLEHSEDINKP